MKKVIVVTGASQGFGKLISLTLADSGHQVIATMRNIATKNKNAADELYQHKNIEVVELDVSVDTSVKDAIVEISNKYSKIDVWINNAGVMGLGIMEATSIYRMQKMFDINFWGVVRCTQAILPIMRKQASGLIINISSGMGIIATPLAAPYIASKFAVEGFTESLQMELKHFGIEMVSVLPGAFPTSIASTGEFDADLEFVKQDYGKTYSGKLTSLFESIATNQENLRLDPQEVADAVNAVIEISDGKRPRSVSVNRFPITLKKNILNLKIISQKSG